MIGSNRFVFGSLAIICMFIAGILALSVIGVVFSIIWKILSFAFTIIISIVLASAGSYFWWKKSKKI